MKISIKIEGDVPANLDAVNIVVIAPGEGPEIVQSISTGKMQDSSFEADLLPGHTFAVRQIEKGGE